MNNNNIIEKIKGAISCHDLAQHFNLFQDPKTELYKLRAEERTASMSISQDGSVYYDHGAGQGGSCIDLCMNALNITLSEAIAYLSQTFLKPLPEPVEGWVHHSPSTSSGNNPRPLPKPVEGRMHHSPSIKSGNNHRPLPEPVEGRVNYFPSTSSGNNHKGNNYRLDIPLLWKQATQHNDLQNAIDYLHQKRRLPEEFVKTMAGKAFGYSNYIPKHKDKDPANYGPAIVFPLHDLHGHIYGLNQRYLADEHSPKVRAIKEKEVQTNLIYSPLLRQAKNSPVVWLVESPIDALTLFAAECPAIAFLSAAYVEDFPLDWVEPKQKIHIWPDRDEAGQKAAYVLYHRLISLGKTPKIIDSKAVAAKDPNDLLRDKGLLIKELHKIAHQTSKKVFPVGNVYIPNPHEYAKLENFECFEDSVCFWDERKEKNEIGEYEVIPFSKHVAGFRVYRMDPIAVYPPRSAMGELDSESPREKTLVLYKRPESPFLQKSVVEKKDIGKPKLWQEFGIIHDEKTLKLLMQSISRDHTHRSETVDVVGLVKLGKNLQINDAHNTYLNNDLCVYHDLIFPSASQADARENILGMAKMLKDYKALICLTWILGSFLKIYLRFWPHLIVIASSRSGKSTLLERLTYLTGAKSFEHTILSSSYQQMRLVGNHAYATLIDEISRAKIHETQEFISLMNASYNYPLRPRGVDKWFLLSGAVGLFGQDFNERDAAITSKMISIDMDLSQGELFHPQNRFPVKSWGEWLINTQNQEKINKRFLQIEQDITDNINSEGENMVRFIKNYAALFLAWELLSEFADVKDLDLFAVIVDLCKQHALETKIIRSESFALLDALAAQIGNDEPKRIPPHEVVEEETGSYLYITTQGILTYLASKNQHFAVTSAKGLIKHLKNDGFLLDAEVDMSLGPKSNRKRFKHVLKLDLRRIERTGINWPRMKMSEL